MQLQPTKYLGNIHGTGRQALRHQSPQKLPEDGRASAANWPPTRILLRPLSPFMVAVTFHACHYQLAMKMPVPP
jgi:hypothetical protein